MIPGRPTSTSAIALLLIALAGRPAWAEQRPPVLLLTPAAARLSRPLVPVEQALGASPRYRLVLLQALITPMRTADDADRIRERAAGLEEEGRKAQLSLDYRLAHEKLEAALALLEQGFVRYYDPRVPAQVRLLLGSLALHQARPDLAREQFVEALHLDPTIQPDAHYSPQVRAAFSDAARNLPPRAEPPAADVRRIAALAGGRIAVVLGLQELGEQSLLKGALLRPGQTAYSGMESVLVEPADDLELKRRAGGLGTRLRATIEALLPAPKPPATRPVVGNGKQNGKRNGKPGPKPWYRRWYTYATAGAVVAVAAAIILPLALREEQVGINVTFSPKPANAP